MSLEFPIYLDHAATTPVAPEALEAMLPYFSQAFANPASIYGPGAEARAAVDSARETIADAIGARPEEVYFTSGGTEANNWALKGVVKESRNRNAHVLTTQIEHSSVLEPAESLRSQSCEVEFMPVDSEGVLDPDEVRRRIQPHTALVSLMVANNEVGSIQPIAEIGAICKEKGVPFHSDAVQAFGKIPLNVRELNLDLMSLSAHKLYGPKGIGALYVRRGTRISTFMEGGEQEKGRRAGTLNVPGIVGFGAACRIADVSPRIGGRGDEETGRITELRDRLIDGIISTVPGANLSGPRPTGPTSPTRLPNNAHFCFEGVEGESLLLALDMAGICASAGSACSAGSTEPSHVLLSMGCSVERARGALRLTLGRSTTEEAVDYTVERLAAVVAELRSLSQGPVAVNLEG